MKMHSTKAQILCNLCLSPFALMLAVSAANAQTTILCGQTVTNSISAAAENDQYTYGGSAGEALAIAMAGLVSGSNAKVVDFYNPGGQIIARLNGFSALS